ncbi:uncharacterized protein KY384_001456 [Bacidia gigantensis]|uniref:uncharacterized protein n=1 Tax=Bacidia gigantensis TaxID=2732470 RepID=UPI001D04FB1F|nr:uncharacterized protein KY384_001456 [Bacidia gigantensis]KAG8533715.1 hypothetical protein KY384_001456 [Bacidia gigantensis]
MAVEQSGWFSKELTGRMLLFIALFHGMHVALFAVGWWKQITDQRLAGLNTLTFSVWISRGAGLALSVDGMIIVLPMCKNLLRIIRPKVRWLPLDESQWFHRQVAYSILFFTTIHVSAHYVNFFNVERNQVRPESAVQIHYTQAGGITGHVMLLCMLFMFTTAHVRIRQQCYEAFWYTHHLFIPFLLAFYTHATGCFVRDSTEPYSPFAGSPFWSHCIGYEGWRWELIGGGLYLCERLYREWDSRRACRIERVIRHPYDALEIQFSKPSMTYKPGQWILVNVPEVSTTQWHPFTITSCPFDSYTSIHVRQVGDWTRALGDAVGAGPTQVSECGLDADGMYEIALMPNQEMPAIRVNGPYGAPAEDVFENEIAVLIGTGIGVTPWASNLKNIFNHRSRPNAPLRLKRVEFIWICRDTKSFEWFQMLLSSLEEQSQEAASESGAGPEFLRIHTYLTQKLDADEQANVHLNTVGMDKDPLTNLSARTNFGRPDFKKLFAAMKDGIRDSTYLGGALEETTGKEKASRKKAEVGVYFCGPNTAAKQIRSACKGVTDSDVRFKFWKEHF